MFIDCSNSNYKNYKCSRYYLEMEGSKNDYDKMNSCIIEEQST